MNSSSSAELGPTEDVVQALLDYLVDHMLPLKSSAREAPSLSQQQSVANQVHAVVLLYNYYQRKHNSAIEFLGFESFCKLAVILKPTLMAHMKLMHRSDYTELDDLENQISLAEKAIMDACDISLALDASKDVPGTEGWRISKVAILLVDSTRENCFLLFSSMTHGVWSVIEKDLDVFNISSEGTGKGRHISKRKRTYKKLLRDEQIAFSAVKEAAGINETDLMVLETHVVYSLSKEKTAARFYIVQCTHSIDEDLQVPIKGAIESLQGPLVKKSLCGWTVSPVVEYFHVLPYAEILSDWLSREAFSNTLQNLRIRTENNCKIEVIEDRYKSKENYGAERSISNKASSGNSKSPKQRDNNRCWTICLSNSVDGRHNMDVDDSSVVCPQNEDDSKSTRNIVKNYHEKKMMTSTESDVCASTSGFEVKAEMVDSMMNSCITECKGDKVDTENQIRSIVLSDQDGTHAGDLSLVSFQLNSKYLENLQATLASRENDLSQTALKVLLRRREKLSHQLRNLEDEIALCDKNIQAILDGGEDFLVLNLEAIIDGCNDVALKTKTKTKSQDRNCLEFEDQGQLVYMKRRLSEAILTMQNLCQELDDICHSNNWTLPTYCVSPSNGGFLANVTVHGMDFEVSGESDLHCSPREARESAAANMIAKLQSMVGQTKLF